MVDEERERNADSVEVMGLQSGLVINVPVIEIENGRNSGGSSGGDLHTYRRRKRKKMSSSSDEKLCEDGKVSTNCVDKTMKEPPDSHASNGSGDGSEKIWAKIALEHMYHSFTEGFLHECFRDALIFHKEGGCISTVRESVHFGEEMRNGTQNAPKDHVGVTSNGSTNDLSTRTNTDMCKHALFNILISTKFAELCALLLGNFQGMSLNCFFDLRPINSRIKAGVYERSPMLFHSDIQEAFHVSESTIEWSTLALPHGRIKLFQRTHRIISWPVLNSKPYWKSKMWRKLENVGNEMAALAKGLSEKSRASSHGEVRESVQSQVDKDQVRESVHSPVDEDQFVGQEANGHANVERTEASSQFRAGTCTHCKKKAQGLDCLVCDNCEEVQHVACIEPAFQEILPKTWYCAKCKTNGTRSTHEGCKLCATKNAPKSSSSTGVDEPVTNEKNLEMEESSDDIEERESGRNCIVCKTMVEENEDFRKCGHPFCPSKYYHESCLMGKQLNTYGSCWYCPSCLCRVCLMDKDDDKIVLCDGCDQGFHTYCMKPPRNSVPSGKWFCMKCKQGRECVSRAKRAFEKSQCKSGKRADRGNGENDNLNNGHREMDVDSAGKSGGVDMLLTAARTLNNEENLAADAKGLSSC